MGVQRKPRITIKDVAELAHVSEATVSNVLSGRRKFSEETAQQVMAAVAQLGYVPDASAQQLRNRRTHTVGLLFPMMEGPGRLEDNPFYWQLATAVEAEGRQQGYRVLIAQTEPDDDLTFVIERNLDGLVILGAYADYPVLQRAQQIGIPVVLVDSYVDQELHQVRINDYEGGRLATQHLIDLGHRRIGMITGTRKARGVHDERYRGYKDALQQAGLPLTPELVVEGPVSVEGGTQMAHHLFGLAEPPTAVFASADTLAHGFMMAAREQNIAIPQQVSVIGFDDLPLSRYLTPSLSTIRQDTYHKGVEAMRLIAQAYQPTGVDQSLVEVAVELVVRESTAVLRKP